MNASVADRNLLFGILALQMDFIQRDQLVAAMNAWVLDKARPLGDILLAQAALSPERRQLLDALVAEHLKQHQGDPQQSLAALQPVGAARQALESLAVPEVQASLTSALARPAVTADGDPFATVSADEHSAEAGRFRIVRPHAAGGLGKVSIALDQELHREVALKEIKAQHADNSEARARFVLEAEITGSLEHPGIVPVYSLGRYGDGRPYYAMRFIKGDSLKEAIDRFHRPSKPRDESAKPRDESANPAGPAPEFHSLEFRKLLGRFVDVCNAMAYAHSRGVLHRDLKPANIMVGKYGETLVVDWGLAKAGNRGQGAGPREQAATLPETMLRPASASGGSETLPGSSLGTPAYMSPEQAAGRLDLIGPAADVYSLGATLYHLLTGQPPLSGDVAMVLKNVQEGGFARPRQIKPGIAPALEAVCLKAMALRPQDRYGSPRELADDVERWLADEAVTAWPEPWSVKAGRWIRRHRALVSSSAAACFVCMVAVTAGIVWTQREQNRQATEQALREADAERKRALAHEKIREALDQADELGKKLRAELREPGKVFVLLNRPEDWRARIQIAQSAWRRAQDLLDQDDAALDAVLSEQAARLEAELRQDEADRALAERLEKIRMDRATLVEGKVSHVSAGMAYPRAFADAGFTVLDDAPAAAARLHASPIREQLLAALDNWAWTAFRLGHDKTLPEKLLSVGRLAAPDPVWGDRLRQVGVWRDQKALNELAQAAPDSGLSPPLLDLVGKLLNADNPAREPWARRAQAQFPGDFWLNFELGLALRPTNPAEAAGFYRVAIAIRPSSSAPYNNLGNVLGDLRRSAEAIAAFKMAIQLAGDYAVAHNNLGGAYLAQKNFAAAETSFRTALQIDPKYAAAYCNLGSVLRDQKKLPEAIDACRIAIKLDPDLAHTYSNLGNILADQQQIPEAIAAYRDGIARDPKYAGAYYNLANTYRDQKQLPEAVAAYRQAIDADPKLAVAYNNLGLALRDQRKAAEAFAAFEKAAALDPQFVLAYRNLADAFRAQKKWREAIAAYRQAIALEPTFANTYAQLGDALLQIGSFAEGAEFSQKALDLLPKQHSARPAYQFVRNQCQQAQQLEKRLPGVLAGSDKPAPADLLKMAALCHQHGKRHRAAVQLYQQAFTGEPALVEKSGVRNRYNAACAAALAGTGPSADGTAIPDKQKAALRDQARTWLRAELDDQASHLNDANIVVLLQLEQRLARAQADPSLSAVREARELSRLPEPEEQAWQKLWADLARLLREVHGRFSETRVEDALTGKPPSKVHEWKLVAGRAYVFDLESAAFDTVLTLEDPRGEFLYRKGGISPEDRNSRLILTESTDGVYRLVVTSFQEAGAGPYTLRIRELKKPR